MNSVSSFDEDNSIKSKTNERASKRNKSRRENMETKDHNFNMDLLIELERIIFNLNEENLESSIEQTMNLFDMNYPLSLNFTILNLVYYSFCTHKNISDIYLKYLIKVQTKEKEINENSPNIIENFSDHMSKIRTQESLFLPEKMIEQNLINSNIIHNIRS